MEGLLPLLVAVIVSIALSRKKKKTPADIYPAPTQESPWDDILREITREAGAGSNAGSFEENEDDYVEDYEAYTSPQDKISGKTVDRTRSGSVPQDHHSSPTLQSSDPFEDADKVSETIYAQASIPDITAQEESSKPLYSTNISKEQKSRNKNKRTNDPKYAEADVNTSLFPHGFDLRDGVLYAEIMTPKFKQNDL